MKQKRVRYLLRVSSDQQLEEDGDLSIQRQIVLEYITKHEEWFLDPLDEKREYFEPGVSAYRNKASNREVLQQIQQDAENHEFDILVLYKDDRMGRLMWDTPLYIMDLKKCGVDIYTVKDGLLTPDVNDIMSQMMLTFRYANAQKSSADTGMRVKDTAQKLVERGKFMGGAAPYGYYLDYSGEISKHGRALKPLVIIPEQAEVVRYIYSLSLNKEYGSARIAKELNQHEIYKDMAPRDVWRSGTVTSILTNPIYAGHTAYKRRERVNGMYHRLDSEEWVISIKSDESIQIIDEDTWDRAQEKRRQRGGKYIKSLDLKDVTVIGRNDGTLALIDVIYCGYCGCKLTNGSRYNYWVIKDTGERRASKIPIYKCQTAFSGVPHDKTKQFRADKIDPIIFDAISEYIGKIQEQEDVFKEIEKNQNKEINRKEQEIKKEKQERDKIEKNIAVMEGKIPLAMQGEYPLSLDELVNLIRRQKEELARQVEQIKEKELELKNATVSHSDWEDIRRHIPSWQEVFLNADTATKRVLINKLVDRISVKKEEIVVRFKINLKDFFVQPRISYGFGVPESGL